MRALYFTYDIYIYIYIYICICIYILFYVSAYIRYISRKIHLNQGRLDNHT